MVDRLAISSIREAQEHAKAWLFETAAPLWATEGVCEDGQFAERLTLDGRRVNMPRRLRVQARQIYSFVAIGALGWSGPWKAIVERAMGILLEHGVEGANFVHLFDEQGNVVDRRRDLYDHAFGLFALAHAARALGDERLEAVAHKVMDEMDANWRRPEGGFWEGEITACPPYRQNPHMHMFEAGLALSQVSGHPRWRSLVEELGLLFRSRFQNADTGAVTEYFSADWHRLETESGRIVEPGHCLEWAWLFEAAWADGAGTPVADALVQFARQHGICAERGVAINEVSLDGEILDGNARLWPQTERLKAAVIRYRRLGSEAERREVVAAYQGLAAYFDTPCRGVWYDRWLADGEWVAEDAPASSFYHIVCGLTELLNCPA